MPKRTLKEVCEAHGLTRAALDYARSNGVNAWSDSEVSDWVKNRRAKSDSKSIQAEPEFVDVPDGGEAMTLDGLERELLSATSPSIATMRKTQISGLKEVVKVRQELGELIPVGEIRERDTRIANAVRQAIIKLENDLPPKGVGLDEAGMQKAFRPVIRAILNDLSDNQSEFWIGKPEGS